MHLLGIPGIPGIPHFETNTTVTTVHHDHKSLRGNMWQSCHILPPSQKNSPEVHFAWLRPRCQRCQPWGFWEGHPTKKPSETLVVWGVQCAMLSSWCINGSLSFSNTPSAAGVSIIFHQFTMFTCSMSWLGVSHAPKTKFTKKQHFFLYVHAKNIPCLQRFFRCVTSTQGTSSFTPLISRITSPSLNCCVEVRFRCPTTPRSLIDATRKATKDSEDAASGKICHDPRPVHHFCSHKLFNELFCLYLLSIYSNVDCSLLNGWVIIWCHFSIYLFQHLTAMNMSYIATGIYWGVLAHWSCERWQVVSISTHFKKNKTCAISPSSV